MTRHAVDAVLALLAGEAVVLALWHRWSGRGPRPGALLPTLAAGAGLLAALRAALGGGRAGAIALWLLVAFGFHLLDLWQRGREGTTQQRPGD